MAVNIKFFGSLIGCWFATTSVATVSPGITPVKACVVTREERLTPLFRAHLADCLGWEDASSPVCHGSYEPITITPLATPDEIQVLADNVSLYAAGRSTLQGHVEVRETARIVNAETATIYRDAATHTVTKIILHGNVLYREPDRLMRARRATIHPEDSSFEVEEVLYRLNTDRANALLPAWGRAAFVQRLPNQTLVFQKATYTTCAPKDKAWQIEAREITLDKVKGRGVARGATLRIADWPVLVAPYLSFPTSKARKSGFLMPVTGYSNVGGVDMALPYYWNIAPNYDATLVPHLFTRRGMMMGGDLRFLTPHSSGVLGGNVLPRDKIFQSFLQTNQAQYPQLQGQPSNRWSVLLKEHTVLTDNLQMHVSYQKVSDSYYLQDFSSNLAVATENQLLHQGDVTYTTDHWMLGGMLQGYQTLHPINQSLVSNTYERLPQLMARGTYDELPLHANFNVLGEFDYFRWPSSDVKQPEGPRYHLNPILSMPYQRPWGYVTPSVQAVENYYDVAYSGMRTIAASTFSRTIPRYSVDSGLYFERLMAGQALTQTIEPRLFYLFVPYHNQSAVPVYDSAYMIFNQNQLFRTNRFSGFDRIGDANQVAYAVTSRWLSERDGAEKASLSVGQLRYFSTRRTMLCYRQDGQCNDNPLMLGYVPPAANVSPITSRATYQLSSAWAMSGDYVYDVYTNATNNGNLNLHYQPASNQIISLGYTYLVNGNILQVPAVGIENNALHQATIASAWPLTEQWSGLGAYSYNVSKGYQMMTMVGMQYDTCCWAMRLLGGRSFKSLSPYTAMPQYNNNVYLQILLKGLGSVANSDPTSTISTYLPGYHNQF